MKVVTNDKLWKKWRLKKSRKIFYLTCASNIKKNKNLELSDSVKNKNDSLYSSIYQKGYQQGLLDGYKKGYFIGWMQGFGYSYDVFLKNTTYCIQVQFSVLLRQFKTAIKKFNCNFSKRLINVVLHISKIFLDDVLSVNQQYLIKRINKLIKQSRYIFQKLQLHVHPDHYHTITNKFGVLMNKYNWTVISDKKIDIYSYRIITAKEEVDASLSSFWHRINDVANSLD
ncbi:Flagellar assembly protein FliH [Buchnera aphidicola (Cinara pseudotaxifoliae)]|uniref:Flagellar assembly protein FliH n=1 Tax=Buchnera aphidicola (Cinara pseudotaxifoliae) TaxID=655384 RepID=A0A451DG69_9GAMM|nr:FliH/SctL family protein [Buchnera aphidicola]VFP85620.1 Flagellar assembly protein FliH [Buchnera aphidicola (Cinara pseudotaxifoliae)]